MRKIVAQESQLIVLGHWAENEAACVEFDITDWEDRYGAGGHFDVLAKRPGDADYYPCQTQRDGNKILWIISSADTAIMGQGTCGLIYRVGDVVAKSIIYSTVVTEGVTNGGDVPEPWEDWTNSILQAGAGIQQSASDASQSAADAATSAVSAEQSASVAGGAASTATDSATAAASAAASAGSAASAAATAQARTEAVLTALESTNAEASTLAPGSQATATWETDADTGARTLTIGVPAGAAGVGAVHYDEAQSLTDEQQDQARTNIGLGNVDNTSDANKPVSTAQQTALNLKADKTALGRTDRSLDYLWKKSEGIIYDTETVHSNANTVTVPSGAMEYASMDMVGGKTIVMNQLVQNGNFANESVWSAYNAHYSVNENIAEITFLATYGEMRSNHISAINGHKYYISAQVKKDTAGLVRFALGEGPYFTSQGVYTVIPQSQTFVQVEKIGTFRDKGGWSYILVKIDEMTDISPIVNVKNVMCVDLTQMFGAGNEPSTVEEFKAIFPLDYYPYTEGTLISAAVDKMVSKKADTTTIIEKNIPQSVISLCPDYGQGTADSFNYIDFAEKKYHHKGSVDSDGVWTELAVEEIIELSSVIPEDFEILQVEAGGTIQFHYPELDNGYSIGVPNDVTYMVDVAEVTV